MTKPVSVLVVDDHAMVRDMLARQLGAEPDLAVLATAANADEALAQAARLSPDVVLMDIDMPGMHCFDAARSLQSLCPRTRVVFLSAFFHDRYIEQALSVRAWGYITKTESEQSLLQAIRKVASGSTYFSPAVQARMVIDGPVPRLAAQASTRASTLSQRELQVLRYLTRGLAKKQIALQMQISMNTVHRHVQSLMTKLDIHDRVELTRFAIREGLAEP